LAGAFHLGLHRLQDDVIISGLRGRQDRQGEQGEGSEEGHG
jgi:hypothetical protein